MIVYFVVSHGTHLHLHVLTHSFPTRRSSDLLFFPFFFLFSFFLSFSFSFILYFLHSFFLSIFSFVLSFFLSLQRLFIRDTTEPELKPARSTVGAAQGRWPRLISLQTQCSMMALAHYYHLNERLRTEERGVGNECEDTWCCGR